MDPQQPTPKPRSRGIYLLPNLFTTACLFGGFYAVLAAMNGFFDSVRSTTACRTWSPSAWRLRS